MRDNVRTGRSRGPSFADNSLDDPTPLAAPGPFHAPQMTYFLADEKTMEASQSHASAALPKQREAPKNSLSPEAAASSKDNDEHDDKLGNARHNWKKNLMQQMSRGSDDSLARSRSSSPRYSTDISRNASPSQPRRRLSQTNLSRPFTPSIFESPAPGSVLSSPRSRRDSDAASYTDDIASQAIASSGEDGEADHPSNLMDSGSAPQLVMPSIKMPSRRPFTERGKNMGRLKVLIAGDSDIGKTSLIKAIVQTCEDIVHVDPISVPPTAALGRRKSSKSRSKSADLTTTAHITEIYASTRAYPAWWSDLEESRILRRRKSVGDSVLERNLCFVDTPGYGTATSCLECINPVIDYIESHLKKFTTAETSDSDIINLLSGSGGSQVDAVFYVISQSQLFSKPKLVLADSIDIKSVDIEFLRRLSPLTNIIPVIAQADKLAAEQLSTLKSAILSELRAADIKPFLFGAFEDESGIPWAVSTATAKDYDTMDASLLMSPDYVQPLVNSELSALVEQVFDRDNISWLRHSTAKKYIQWRHNSSPVERPQSLYRPLSSVSSQVLTAPVGATTSYALARITDHTQREERLAQIRLSTWAAELQRSLRDERNRFDQLARSERAVWLTERLGECVQDGTIIPISEARQTSFYGDSAALVKKGAFSRRAKNSDSLNPHDPLGLLQLNADLKKRGLLALQVVSSFGIIGGLAVWITRSWHADNGVFTWSQAWSELSMVDWR